MAAVLVHHSYSPGPGRGILLNPSPAASPAYHPASLPALVPSNSSLSSSASSSSPGDDYFSSKSSSPSPGPSSGSPVPRNSVHLHPHSKSRQGSNPSTVRRIRFAPLPEPRRDLEPADVPLPSVFFDDEAEASHPHDQQPLSLSSALAAATISLAAPADSELCRRTRSLPPSVTSSPCAAKKALPGDSLLLDPSSALPSSASDANDADAQPTTAPSDLGQEWDVLRPSSPALPALSLSLSTPESPRKSGKWSKMLKPLLGRSSGTKSSLTRTMSAEEIAAMNGEAQRGRGPRLGLAGSRSSSRSRDASVSRERDQGRERKEADFGLPLHRWTSEGQPVLPVNKKKKLSLFGGGGGSSGGGVPLGRTQSLTSLSSKDDRKAAKPVIVTNGGRKQQRMLNGRVYGAKRNANPFANVRSEEPEFVEWGYGGMGSVKSSAGQSEIWSRVQKGNVAIGGNEQPAWGSRSSAPEEDDGSGMAWLKRRREQREREKREREEREKAEAEKTVAEGEQVAEKAEESAPVETSPTTADVKETEDAPTAPPTSANTTVTPTPASSTPLPPETHHSPSREEHITQTVSIPAPAHHRHHSHSHSHSHGHHHAHGHGHSLSLSLPHPERRESADTARGVPFAPTPTAGATPTGVAEKTEDGLGTPIPSGARLRKESVTEGEGGESLSSSATSTASTASDDLDDSEDSPKDTEGGFGDEDEDEEEEELLQVGFIPFDPLLPLGSLAVPLYLHLAEPPRAACAERSRLTAVGAGVEKIARHKEHEHVDQQAITNGAAEASEETSS
ncbi:hypothetical protein C8Q73DRAFT_793037 [Cubamyces lactineus]|nr:hypothetical protein C8Q73DRAFT_793037 [Cubamyces lactineus]